MDLDEAIEVLDRFSIRVGVSAEAIRNMNNRTFHSLFRLWQSPIREHVSRNQLEVLQDIRRDYVEPDDRQ